MNALGLDMPWQDYRKLNSTYKEASILYDQDQAMEMIATSLKARGHSCIFERDSGPFGFELNKMLDDQKPDIRITDSIAGSLTKMVFSIPNTDVRIRVLSEFLPNKTEEILVGEVPGTPFLRLEYINPISATSIEYNMSMHNPSLVLGILIITNKENEGYTSHINIPLYPNSNELWEIVHIIPFCMSIEGNSGVILVNKKSSEEIHKLVHLDPMQNTGVYEYRQLH